MHIYPTRLYEGECKREREREKEKEKEKGKEEDKEKSKDTRGRESVITCHGPTSSGPCSLLPLATWVQVRMGPWSDNPNWLMALELMDPV